MIYKMIIQDINIPQNIHANAVLFQERGFLFIGKAGSGKSDLTLRLMEAGGTLISDDRTILIPQGDMLCATPPDNLAGKIEVRGIGIITVNYTKYCPIDIICELSTNYPRIPEEKTKIIRGKTYKYFIIHPFEISSIAKLRIIAHYDIL